MKHYLAGPMTGLPNYGYDRFASAASNLRSTGISVFSPHEIDFPGEPGSLPYMTYIKAGLLLLLECDAIILLPGWTDSRGARLELHAALTLDMVVYYYLDTPPYLTEMD